MRGQTVENAAEKTYGGRALCRLKSSRRVWFRGRYAAEEESSPREMDLLRPITNRNANKQIAARLSIGEETVKSTLRTYSASWAPTIGLMPSRCAYGRWIIEL